MKIRFALLLSVMCVWLTGAPETAFIPHITSEFGWETRLVATNAGYAPVGVTVLTYTDGVASAPIQQSVPIAGRIELVLTAGSCGQVTWDGDNLMLAVVYRHTVDLGTASFLLSTNTETELHYPMPAYLADRLDWMGLAVMNPGVAEAWIALTAYDQDGNILGEATAFLGARRRQAAMAGDFFPGLDFHRLARVRVVSDQPVCGCQISGSGCARLLFLPATGPAGGAEIRFLPHVTTDQPEVWENLLVLDNTGSIPVSPTLHLGAPGRDLARETVTVPAGACRVIRLAEVAGAPAECGWISGCSPELKARLCYVAESTGGTAEYDLDLDVTPELSFQIPAGPASDFDWHGLAVHNPGPQPNTVVLKAFRDGQEVARELVALAPGERCARMLDELFPQAGPGIERVLASGDAPLAGLNMSGAALDRLLFTPAAPYTETRTFRQRLDGLPGVQVIQILPIAFYPAAYILDITQPLDHDRPGGTAFNQRIYLCHLDPGRPMVMYTGGYAVTTNRLTELGDLLQANQIRIPHRFFADAVPPVLDWQFLTIRQAAADHHRIVTLLRDLYRGPWVNTGGSKSGMTSLFHRRFYPDDVTATVAYVAPLMNGLEDPRPIDMIRDELGDESCRDRIWAYKRDLLLERWPMVYRIANLSAQTGLPFSMGYEAALENAVLEMPFSFWQYGPSDCLQVPGPAASYNQMFNFLEDAIPLETYSDPYVEFFYPAYYQFFTETGYTAILHEHLDDLLHVLPAPTYAAFLPPGVETVYRPEVMQDIVAWLQSEGDRIIYIYGGWDPWTGCAIELAGEAEALKVTQPGADHGVQILNLDQRDLVLDTLGGWLGMDIVLPKTRWPHEPNESMSPFQAGRDSR